MNLVSQLRKELIDLVVSHSQGVVCALILLLSFHCIFGFDGRQNVFWQITNFGIVGIKALVGGRERHCPQRTDNQKKTSCQAHRDCKIRGVCCLTERRCQKNFGEIEAALEHGRLEPSQVCRRRVWAKRNSELTLLTLRYDRLTQFPKIH